LVRSFALRTTTITSAHCVHIAFPALAGSPVLRYQLPMTLTIRTALPDDPDWVIAPHGELYARKPDYVTLAPGQNLVASA